MEIHHLNCGTMRPFGKRFVEGNGSFFDRGDLVTHCLLLVGDDQLLLVDTGFGREEVREPGRLDRATRWAMQPVLDEAETASEQIRRLGYDPGDVSDVVITHLDVDHAGGLADFPDATIHLLRPEHEVTREKNLKQRLRYFDRQWDHEPNWNPLDADGEWFGFDAVPLPTTVPGEPMLVSLPGHSPGHAGFAVRYDDRWILHAADAYFDHREMNLDSPSCAPALRLLQWSIAHDNSARKRTQKRLRDLKRDRSGLELFNAHSRRDYARYEEEGVG